MAHKWKKLQILGSGSFGTVSLAGRIDPFTSQQYFLAAVKSSCLERASSLKLEAKLLQEFRGCPYIVQCFGEDLSIEKGQLMYNLLLEFASDGTLDTLIRRYNGLMPERLVAFYSHQILMGLRYIHNRGFVHCDIKPANILLFPTHDHRLHRLKIADFGLAKKVTNSHRRRTGHIRGTTAYASPESISYGEHQAAMDIWSFGCVVLKMFTGKSLWKFTDTEDLLKQIVEEGPEIPSSISDSGRDFLEKCFEKDPYRRWTAQQLSNHPFILNNLMAIAPFTQATLVFSQINPFGPCPFISKEGLFSDTISSGQKHHGSYQLFQGSFLCGEALIKESFPNNAAGYKHIC